MRAFKGPAKQKGFLQLVALGVSALGLGSSISQGRKAAKAGKAANEAQKKINRLRNAQSKRAFLRKFRQTQADNISTAIAAGIGLESSRTQGIAASEKTQGRVGLREFAEFDRLGAEVSDKRQEAASANFRSAAYGQVASFASKFISFGK